MRKDWSKWQQSIPKDPYPNQPWGGSANPAGNYPKSSGQANTSSGPVPNWTPPGPAPSTQQNYGAPTGQPASYTRPTSTMRSLRVGMVSPGIRGQQAQQQGQGGEDDFMSALRTLMQQFGGQGGGF